jgi:hypothetical protein
VQNACSELQSWVASTVAALQTVDRATDVAGAELLLEKHYELRDEIRDKRDEFAYVQDLGERLLKKSPQLTEVKVGFLGDF